MKKIAALFLALSMILAMAACGTQPSASSASAAPEASASEPTPSPTAEPTVPDDAEASTEEATEASVIEEPVEKDLETIEAEAMDLPVELPLTTTGESLSFWIAYPPFLTNFININDKQVYTTLEEVTGVHLNIDGCSLIDGSTVFNLMVASGDYDDIISGFGMQYAGSFDEAIDQEILVDIAPYLTEYAPNYNYLLENCDDIGKACYTDEGHIGEFSYINDSHTAIRGGLVLRGDMLREVGLESPTTYAEMENVLVAFRDQLGLEAPYWSNSSGILAELMAGYGITTGYYQVDGEVRYGYAQDEFLDYLTMMNKWYNEGLLYHDFISVTANQQFPDDSMVNANQCGIFYESLNQFLGYDSTTSGAPDFQISGMAYPALNKGDTTHFSSVTGTVNTGTGFAISTGCDNVELATQWCNYWFTRDGSLLANYGVEGVSFEYNDEGKPQFTDLVTNNPDGLVYDIAVSIYTSFNENAYIADNTKTDANYTEDQLQAIETWSSGADTQWVYSPYASLTAEESDAYNNANSELETYVAEMALKFIVGETPLSEFDAFRETLDNMGLQTCIEAKQSALDRYNNRG